MDSTPFRLPDDAMAAAHRGDLIEAIKLTRARTGLGLKEAKDAVDAYVAGKPVNILHNVSASFSFPAAAIAAAESGNEIEAIKIVRAETGLGLKEAKDMVANYLSTNPAGNSRSQTIARDSSNPLGKIALAALLIAGVITAILAMTGKL